MAFVRKGMKISHDPIADDTYHTPSELIEFAKERGIPTNPLNISELAHQLGIVVNFEPMNNDDSGSLVKDEGRGKWVMTVNSLHHPHRQRFTMAHELGHWVKHAPHCDNFHDKTFFRNVHTNWMEAEANQFAGELLMPTESFIDLVKKLDGDVEQLARHYQVSSMAVRVRAKALGLKGHNL